MARKYTKEEASAYIGSRIKEDEDGCWIWQLSLDRRGYGQAHDGLKAVKAHRLSYETFNENLDEWVDFNRSLIVRHICHKPACVNPFHLKTGSQKDNIRDMIVAGRDNWPSGEKARDAKISNAQAVFARSMYRSGVVYQSDLAEMLNVEKHIISDLLTRSYQVAY